MPRVKLTETFLQRDIKFPKKGQIDYWDTVTTGFTARASYKKTISFGVKKPINGVPTRHTIHPHYDKEFMPLARGREEALKAIKLMAAGQKPSEVAAAVAAEAANVRGDTYGKAVEDFVKVFHQGKKKNRHWKEPLRLLLWPEGGKPRKRDTNIDVDGHLWKGRAVSQITDVEIARLLDRIVADGKGYTANRVHAAMGTFFKWCATPSGGKRILDSPMTNITRPFDDEKPRERVFDDVELKAIWNAANNLGQMPGAFLKMALLTGKRRGAVVSMRWDEISDDWVWTPGPDKQSRTKKAFAAPLPPLAQRTLSGLPTRKDNPHVFFGRVEGKHLDAGSPLQKLIKKKSGINDFLFHAIRHTVETKLAEGWEIDGEKYRVPPHIRDLVLDHVPLRGSGAG